MGCAFDDEGAAVAEVLFQVAGVDNGGHDVFSATDSEGRQLDLRDAVHDVELVAGSHVVVGGGGADLQLLTGNDVSDGGSVVGGSIDGGLVPGSGVPDAFLVLGKVSGVDAEACPRCRW